MNYEEKHNVLMANIAKKGTAAQETEISAMLNWKIASSREDAIAQIEANADNPDLAGIAGSVLAAIGDKEDIVKETDFSSMAGKTAMDIVEILDKIHVAWVLDNINAKRLAQKYFKGQLFQYNSTGNISWSEVKKDYLFIASYIAKSGNKRSEQELEDAFEAYSYKAHYTPRFDADVDIMFRNCAPFIIAEIEKYRDDPNQPKDAEMVAQINEFLEENERDGKKIMEQMILKKEREARFF